MSEPRAECPPHLPGVSLGRAQRLKNNPGNAITGQSAFAKQASAGNFMRTESAFCKG
jgi:hypothetical protein